MSLPLGSDKQLTDVADEVRKLDPDGHRVAQVLRDTIDQLYDGQRTGRYRWDQLYKTEKTHCGTLVEINLQREFRFNDGQNLDFEIAEVQVDCKFSQTLGGWMIPPEARGHLCLLVWAIDSSEPKWSMGLVRISGENLNAPNRDAKATLNSAGRSNILWLFANAPLPPNVLLQLPDNIVNQIMSAPSGQKRINELFRLAQGKIVGRAVIATVAQQDDYMKRLRTNGGARTHLAKEGIVILGQYKAHVDIARILGLPVPGKGESISVRLIPGGEATEHTVEIEGRHWRIAKGSDPVVPAPKLPNV